MLAMTATLTRQILTLSEFRLFDYRVADYHVRVIIYIERNWISFAAWALKQSATGATEGEPRLTVVLC